MGNLKKYLLGGSAVALLVTALSFSSFAEDVQQKIFGFGGMGGGMMSGGMGMMADLSEEDLAQMEEMHEGMFGDLSQEELDEMQEMHEQMTQSREEIIQAVLDGDYDVWAGLVSDMPNGDELLEKITEENFPRFKEAHELMQDARENMESAQKIFTELGIDNQKGFGMKMGSGRFGGGHMF